MQTVWKGTISFGLVSIPVRLVGATEERDIAFRQVRRSDGSRVRYKRVAEVDGEEVPYAEIAKGFELPDGDVVVLSDDDLADLPVASGKAVDVLTFVPLAEIDPTALTRAYYAEPTGDAKPYVLLREALEESGQVALVKLALRNRERLAVLRPRDGVLVVQTMLWPDEVRRPDFRFLDSDVELRPQEKAMAESFITAMSGEFEPAAYHDEYREALESLVQAKIDGRELTRAPEAEVDTGNVVDLMEALRRSVAAAKAARGQAEPSPASENAEASLAGDDGGGDASERDSDDAPAPRRRAGTSSRRGKDPASGQESKPPAAKPAARAGQSKSSRTKGAGSKGQAEESAEPPAKRAAHG